MMKRALIMMAVVAAACGTKKDDKPSSETSKPGQPETATPEPAPEPAPDAAKAPQPVKALEMSGIGNQKTVYLIDVAPGFEVKLQDVEEPDVLPSAHVSGDGIGLNVEAEIWRFDRTKKELAQNKAEIVYEKKLGDRGFELIVKYSDGKLRVMLARDDLDVVCNSGGIPERAAADKILAICQTLRKK